MDLFLFGLLWIRPSKINSCASAYIAKAYGGNGVMIHKLLSSALGGQSLTSRYTSGYRNKSVNSIELQRQPEYKVETKNNFARNSYNGAKTDLCQNTVLTNETWLSFKWQLPSEYCRQVTDPPLYTLVTFPRSLPQSAFTAQRNQKLAVHSTQRYGWNSKSITLGQFAHL